MLLESEDELEVSKTPEPDVTRNVTQSRQTTDSDKTPHLLAKRKNKNDSEDMMINSFRNDWKSPKEIEMGKKHNEEFDMFHPPFPIKPEIVTELVSIGFTLDHVIESLANNHANHCSATYYLYDKD